MIEKLHDELFEKLTVLQMNMDQCSKAFGSNTKVPLISQIIDLKTRQTDLEKRLKVSEKRRNKYCEQITKLDLNVRNLASELQINEEKLKNKEKKVTEYKHQIQILEDELKLTEKKSTELEDVTHVRQMKNEKVQKENEQLIREKHVYQPNSTNSTGTKENLNGTLKLSNQSKVNRTDKNEENESTSTRQSQNPIVKIDGPQTEKGRLNQGSRRIQRRYNDYYSLSYIGGSIQNSKPDVNITNEEEELSNNNSLKAPTPRLQPEGRSKLQVPTVAKHRLFHYESTEHQPRKATTTQMLNKQFHQQILMTVMPERNAKKQAERTSPSRKGNKSKSLLRTLATNRLKMEKIQK